MGLLPPPGEPPSLAGSGGVGGSDAPLPGVDAGSSDATDAATGAGLDTIVIVKISL